MYRTDDHIIPSIYPKNLQQIQTLAKHNNDVDTGGLLIISK